MMRGLNFFPLGVVFFLIACSTPQVIPATDSLFITETETLAPIATVTPLNETIILIGGLEVELGKPDDKGNKIIAKFLPPAEFSADDKSIWLVQFDTTRFHLNGTWVKLADGRVLLISNVSNFNTIIAEWQYVEKLKSYVVVWDWAKMVEESGEHVLLSIGEVWEMQSGVPVDIEGRLAYGRDIREHEFQEFLGLVKRNTVSLTTGITSLDGKRNVVFLYAEFGTNDSLGNKWPYDSEGGYVFTRDAKGNSIMFYARNIPWNELYK